MDVKKISKISMLLSISVVLSLIESIIPIVGIIPGIKLGLANIVVLYILYTMTLKDALYVSILRVILVGILRAGLFNITFLFSLSGALFSLIFMFLFKKITKLSIVGISIIGSIFHCIGQIIVAIILLSNINIIYYLPVLLFSSIITGIVIGLCTNNLIKLKNN